MGKCSSVWCAVFRCLLSKHQQQKPIQKSLRERESEILLWISAWFLPFAIWQWFSYATRTRYFMCMFARPVMTKQCKILINDQLIVRWNNSHLTWNIAIRKWSWPVGHYACNINRGNYRHRHRRRHRNGIKYEIQLFFGVFFSKLSFCVFSVIHWNFLMYSIRWLCALVVTVAVVVAEAMAEW